MAAGEKVKARFEEFKERVRNRVAKTKRTTTILVGAGIGGAAHGAIKAKTKGKTLGGKVTYAQAGTAVVTIAALKDDRLVGAAAGALGATTSNAVEEAIERAEQNAKQGQQPPARAAARPEPVGNVVPMAAQVRR